MFDRALPDRTVSFVVAYSCTVYHDSWSQFWFKVPKDLRVGPHQRLPGGPLTLVFGQRAVDERHLRHESADDGQPQVDSFLAPRVRARNGPDGDAGDPAHDDAAVEVPA